MGCAGSQSTGPRMTNAELAEEEQVSKSISKHLEFEEQMSEYTGCSHTSRRQKCMIFGFEQSGRNTLALLLESELIARRIEKLRVKEEVRRLDAAAAAADASGDDDEKKQQSGGIGDEMMELKLNGDADDDDDDKSPLMVASEGDENETTQQLVGEEQHILYKRAAFVFAMTRQRICQLTWNALQSLEPFAQGLIDIHDLNALSEWIGGEVTSEDMDTFLMMIMNDTINDSNNNNNNLIEDWLDKCDESLMTKVLGQLLMKPGLNKQVRKMITFDYACAEDYRFYQQYFNPSLNISETLRVFQRDVHKHIASMSTLKGFDDRWLWKTGICITLKNDLCAHCILAPPLTTKSSIALDFFNAPRTHGIPHPSLTDSVYTEKVYCKRNGGFWLGNDEHFRRKIGRNGEIDAKKEECQIDYPRKTWYGSAPEKVNILEDDPWRVDESMMLMDGEEEEKKKEGEEKEEDEDDPTKLFRMGRLRFWPKSLDRFRPSDSASLFVFDLNSISQWFTLPDGKELNGFVANLIAYQQWCHSHPKHVNKPGNRFPVRHVLLTYSSSHLNHICGDLGCDLFSFFEMSHTPSMNRVWNVMQWYQSWIIHEQWMKQYCQSNEPGITMLELANELFIEDRQSIKRGYQACCVISYWLRQECEKDSTLMRNVIQQCGGLDIKRMFELVSIMVESRKFSQIDSMLKQRKSAQMEILKDRLLDMMDFILCKSCASCAKLTRRPHLYSLDMDNPDKFQEFVDKFVRSIYRSLTNVGNMSKLYERVFPDDTLKQSRVFTPLGISEDVCEFIDGWSQNHSRLD